MNDFGVMCRPKNRNGPKLETRPQFSLLGRPDSYTVTPLHRRLPVTKQP